MELRRIYSRHFPIKRYIALTICPFVFIREDTRYKYTVSVDRHETTHALQQVETLWVLFLIIYGLEYVIKLAFCGLDHLRAYHSISFEQEACDHEEDLYYNDIRRHYAWVKYIFKLKDR